MYVSGLRLKKVAVHQGPARVSDKKGPWAKSGERELKLGRYATRRFVVRYKGNTHMPHLPQPARGGRSIAAGGFIRRTTKSPLPEAEAPVLKNAVREPSADPQPELLASDSDV